MNGRYRIEAPLGQGGMSAVYRATDPNLRRTVAIKLIHSHLAADPEFVRRFEEEAAAVARLRHPNIIQVFDFNHDGSTYYMVLEFLPGHTLLDRLEQANQQHQLLSLAETANIMIPLCEAVAYAHEQGMIHRDLKPANVMINPQGQPILMDFGIAKIVGGAGLTATGGVIGTVAYMSPEQIRGQKPDHRADIYALGIILYQMISGRLPFQGENTAATMMQHLSAPVPDVRQFNQAIPPALVAIVQKSLAKEPAQRYQSAGEMAAALKQLSGDAAATRFTSAPTTLPNQQRPATGPIQTRPQTGATRSTTGMVAPSTGSTPTPAKRPAWMIPAAAALGLLILLVCIVAAVLAGQQLLGDKTPTPTATTFFVASAPTSASTEAPAVAGEAETTEEVADSAAASATTTPPPTATPRPVATATVPTPTTEPPTLIPTNTSAPTVASSPTSVPTAIATQGLRAEITNITIANGQYVVEFQVFGYFSDTSSTHVHFFWNTIAPDQAGVPASPGNWKLYGSPSPFTGYAVTEKPSGATQMCILVANPNHSVQLGTGNCVDLPG